MTLNFTGFYFWALEGLAPVYMLMSLFKAPNYCENETKQNPEFAISGLIQDLEIR